MAAESPIGQIAPPLPDEALGITTVPGASSFRPTSEVVGLTNIGKRVFATGIVLTLVPWPFVGARWKDKCERGPLIRGRCIEVVGDLEIWNGWPPNLGIEAKKNHKLYGIGPIETDVFPEYPASPTIEVVPAFGDHLPVVVHPDRLLRRCPHALDVAQLPSLGGVRVAKISR